jgi:DNA-directed RNA polymerase specialized sigma24 family protein
MSGNGSPAPQHVLARRATALSRRIYGSLPWGYRIAGLLVVLSGDSLDAFGKVIAGEMILAVVRGMPDVGGRPAFDWIREVQTEGAEVLPPGTGRQFAAKVYKVLLTRFGSPDVAQEAMSNVLLQVARHKLHIKNGASVHEAESYVITIALNAARDILRAQGRRRENPLVRDRDDDEVTIDVEDPESFRNLDQAITRDQMGRMLRDLEEVHPRAPDYVRALLDGDSATEIAEDWRVTPSYVSKFKRLVGPEIRRFVQERFRSASTPSYYRP